MLGALILLLSYPLIIAGGWGREQVINQRISAAGPGPYEMDPIGPAWLVERIPGDLARFLERRVAVVVTSRAEPAWCGKLRHLRRVRIEITPLPEAALVHLQGLGRLRYLVLAGTDGDIVKSCG